MLCKIDYISLRVKSNALWLQNGHLPCSVKGSKIFNISHATWEEVLMEGCTQQMMSAINDYGSMYYWYRINWCIGRAPHSWLRNTSVNIALKCIDLYRKRSLHTVNESLTFCPTVAMHVIYIHVDRYKMCRSVHVPVYDLVVVHNCIKLHYSSNQTH